MVKAVNKHDASDNCQLEHVSGSLSCAQHRKGARLYALMLMFWRPSPIRRPNDLEASEIARHLSSIVRIFSL